MNPYFALIAMRRGADRAAYVLGNEDLAEVLRAVAALNDVAPELGLAVSAALLTEAA